MTAQQQIANALKSPKALASCLISYPEMRKNFPSVLYIYGKTITGKNSTHENAIAFELGKQGSIPDHDQLLKEIKVLSKSLCEKNKSASEPYGIGMSLSFQDRSKENLPCYNLIKDAKENIMIGFDTEEEFAQDVLEFMTSFPANCTSVNDYYRGFPNNTVKQSV